MRKILIAAVIAALAAAVCGGSATAQSVGGKYTVKGKNLDGSGYGGTARIRATGSGCHIEWRTGSTSWSGICMLANQAFAAYYSNGNTRGMVIYELHGDGSLSGWWTIVDKEGVGTETLTPE